MTWIRIFWELFLGNSVSENRIFDRFGFDLPKAINILKKEPSKVTFYNNWEFDDTVSDWIDPQSGKRLTGFSPSGELIELLENKIDTDKN